jgi:hypothetical protein
MTATSKPTNSKTPDIEATLDIPFINESTSNLSNIPPPPSAPMDDHLSTNLPSSLPSTIKPPPPSSARGKDLFDNIDLQLLWNHAITKDPSYQAVHASVSRGDRCLPPEVDAGTQMPDCALDEHGALTYREALWIPEHEPLRTIIL